MKRPLIATAGIASLAILISCGKEPTAPITPPVTVPPQDQMPITGTLVPGMTSYDETISALMKKWKVPGGAVAVLYNGRLVYARGFGYSDVENKTPVQPDALFRIASVSKTFTSAAIMTLVGEGKLSFDDPVAPFVDYLAPAAGATVDPRWEQITIRNLLNHTGGWDRGKPNGGFDPIDRTLEAAAEMGAPSPASPETLIRWMKGKPLDFNPGEKFAYSNFGYIILGRVIERLTGMPYKDYVRTRVLEPAGAKRTQQGKSRMSDALPGEVKYYWPGSATVNFPMVPSVFPGEGLVPINYGGYYFEVGDASGAWVSSTVDLLRFLSAIDGRPTRPDILSGQLIAQMTGSGAPLCPNNACYYAAGWMVGPVQGDANWWHGGDLPSTVSFLLRSYNNYSWAAVFNTNPTLATGAFDNELDVALWDALKKITELPAHDLFSSFQ
ncbi:MAG TPA: serine hydrolase domain-containing protein [Gemmatimonadaceae bacterium]